MGCAASHAATHTHTYTRQNHAARDRHARPMEDGSEMQAPHRASSDGDSSVRKRAGMAPCTRIWSLFPPERAWLVCARSNRNCTPCSRCQFTAQRGREEAGCTHATLHCPHSHSHLGGPHHLFGVPRVELRTMGTASAPIPPPQPELSPRALTQRYTLIDLHFLTSTQNKRMHASVMHVNAHGTRCGARRAAGTRPGHSVLHQRNVCGDPGVESARCG